MQQLRRAQREAECALVLVLLVAALFGADAALVPPQWYRVALQPPAERLAVTHAMPAMTAVMENEPASPTVLSGRTFYIPPGLTCYDLAVDVPLARRWPGRASNPANATDPGHGHFFIWRDDAPPTGSWAFASSVIHDSWIATLPYNRSWAPVRQGGTYRFIHHLAPPRTLPGGHYYFVGVYWEVHNASYAHGNWLGWMAQTGSTYGGAPFRYVDANANYATSDTVAAAHVLFGDAPSDTLHYAGVPLTYLALTAHANCTFDTAFGLDPTNNPSFGAILPEPVIDLDVVPAQFVVAPALADPVPAPALPVLVPAPSVAVPSPSVRVPSPPPPPPPAVLPSPAFSPALAPILPTVPAPPSTVSSPSPSPSPSPTSYTPPSPASATPVLPESSSPTPVTAINATPGDAVGANPDASLFGDHSMLTLVGGLAALSLSVVIFAVSIGLVVLFIVRRRRHAQGVRDILNTEEYTDVALVELGDAPDGVVGEAPAAGTSDHVGGGGGTVEEMEPMDLQVHGDPKKPPF